jgi:hypothetical protein
MQTLAPVLAQAPTPQVVGTSATTVADVVPADEVHPDEVTVTLYGPDAAVVAFGIDGFCWFDENPFGPVQLYDAPATVEVLSCSVEFAQIGPLFEGDGVAGTALTIAVVFPAAEVQPPTVTVTL